MAELNELSIVLIVLMAIIIASIVILGQRKKKKYQESAEKAKQQSQELRAQSKATPSKDAARFEDGRIIPSKKPFGRNANEAHGDADNNEPYISDIDESQINPNQQELSFDPEPSIGNVETETAQVKQNHKVTAVPSDNSNNANDSVTEEAPELRDIAQQAIDNLVESDQISESSEEIVSENSESNLQSENKDSQERQRLALEKIMNSDRVEPKTFALIVMGQQQIDLTDIHQFMMANNLRHTHQGFYEYQDNQGNMIFQAVNMLKPGTFPLNPSLKDKTPGVMFILDLPTPYSTAPAAMHNFITVARKLANRTDAQVFNEEQHVVGEHYYHSLRDSALGYESQKLVN
ncbi:hypothetical protein J3998_03310 [Thiomicrorhabdus sp. 6S2-11]|uniref:Cell division protein ZipA n=1 Tax=Thiomicrorhabdus marina TaxID=2818442 RepID=A0ABS3Q2N0_9GAMM|nr:cell division protein ZipA C-terminal FtsZ-binding domain-containing protein [Thiomicrorhabdus marina]MBO1926594.1 hypothetical protein [Thiomicrorhabdus marina]